MSLFLELLGGKRKLHQYVLGLHRGSIEWPEELSLRTGWFARKGEETTRSLVSAESGRFVSPKTALRRVSEITGTPPSELRRTVRGPRANPPRRFAVWALARQTLLTHVEIGKLLDMSTNQVANVLKRVKKNWSLPDEWMDRWRELNNK